MHFLDKIISYLNAGDQEVFVSLTITSAPRKKLSYVASNSGDRLLGVNSSSVFLTWSKSPNIFVHFLISKKEALKYLPHWIEMPAGFFYNVK